MKRETLQFAKQDGKKRKIIQIDKNIKKRGKIKPLDGSPSLELADPVGLAGFAAACFI